MHSIEHTSPVIEPATPAEAQAFHRAAMPMLDGHMVDQALGKEGLLTAMAGGFNIALVGEPSGGKTMLAKASINMVEGLHPNDPRDVFKIPVQIDLRPEQVAGNQLVTRREVTLQPDVEVDERKTSREASRLDIEALMDEYTRVIFGNEFNRVSPNVRNTILEVFQDGTLDRAGKTVNLDLLYAIATMNPGDRRDGVYPIFPAEAARFAIGVAMGNEEGQKRRENIIAKAKHKPSPITPIVSVEDLKRFQALSRSENVIAFPDSLLENQFVDLVTGTQDALDEAEASESDYRMIDQLIAVARTRAALGGEHAIDLDHLKEAVHFVLGARIGMLTVDSTTKIKKVIENAYDQATDGVN